MNNAKIKQMSFELEQAIMKCDTFIEGFECAEICTGKTKKSFLESNESKSVLLILGLIVFYGALTY